MTEDETILGRAIAKVTDDSVRQTIEREVALLRGSRKFGLVFDRHLPESVRLIGHPVRPGVKVALRDESISDEWRVVGFTDRSRATVLLDDDSTRAVDDLVVVREFGEPIYPGLVPLERIQRGGDDAPWHTVINGENFHALQLLRETHRGQVDLIYIDPPYNTGNDGWIYNDRFVLDADRAKSSKWLSFMERRLTIARDFLKPTGVIIVAIGDDEHHRLRILMDQVFGASNFISDVVWQGGRKNDSRYVSNGADYMLIYARDSEALTDIGGRWRESKLGLTVALEKASELWLAGGDADPNETDRAWKAWLKAAKSAGEITDAVARYDRFDWSSGRPINTYQDLTWPGGGGATYEVLHPTTRLPVKVPSRGWIYSDPGRMQQEIDAGRVWFGEDESVIPRRITYLDEMDTQVALSVFAQDRKVANTRFRQVLGDLRFPNPKDHEVLMRWFRMAAPKDALILDFFVGSGSTTEAVMRLNAEDGGARQSIVVTNNEVGSTAAKKLRKDGHHPGDPEWESQGVFEYVTRPRISTVVTGVRPDGSTYSDGLDANVEFLKLTYLDPGSVRRGREFASIAPILWLENGATGERIDEDPGTGWALTDTYGVLFDVDALEAFAAAAEERMPDRVYVVSDSPAEVRAVASRLPGSVEVVALYDDYLHRFEGNVDR